MIDYLQLSIEERRELEEKVRELRDSGKYTRQEIGDKLGITRERVLCIYNKLIRKEHGLTRRR